MQNRLSSVYGTIAEACSRLDAQLVLSLGRPGAATTMRSSNNALIVDYAPQTALLRRAALTITHGGLNTVLESLSAGVPLVVTPIANDQPGNAVRVEALGVGRFLPIGELEVNSLRTTIADVLATPAFAKRARVFAAELAQLDGPALAAELIERAFLTGKRVTRASRAASSAIGATYRSGQ
jgi:MGT family glycosyltransferase